MTAPRPKALRRSSNNWSRSLSVMCALPFTQPAGAKVGERSRPHLGLRKTLPGCTGATTAAKLMLATLLETAASRLPTYRLWNVVDDISGPVAGSPRMVQVLTGEAARLLVEASSAAPAAFQGKVQSPHRRHGHYQARLFYGRCSIGDGRVRHGAQRWSRSAVGQATTSPRR